jgi:hypothetical protein
MSYAVLKGPDHVLGDDVAVGPDREEIAKSSVEDEFGGDPRIAATKNGSERFLGLD